MGANRPTWRRRVAPPPPPVDDPTMRRLALGSALFLLLVVACGSFSSTTPEPGTEHGGAGESGPSDAAGDATSPEADASHLADAGPDGGDLACTVFDRLPDATTGWGTAIAGTGGALTFGNRDGRGALHLHVDANNQRVALVHDVSLGISGTTTIETDFIAATTPAPSGSLVELLVLECSNPKLKIALEVAPSGALLVESTPSTGEILLGSPTNTWRTLKFVVTGNAFHVELGAQVFSQHTMLSTFANASGCTVSVGANAIGNIVALTVDYSRACIR